MPSRIYVSVFFFIFSLPNHTEQQVGACDIHPADLFGEEVQVVETIVVGRF